MLFFPPSSSQTKPKKCLWFLGSDGSCEFVFNLELSQEHAGFSPKIGSTESGWGGKRGGRRRRRRRRGGKEERRGVWLMSTRCLTFGGSHILWSFSWCVICARTYVRRDAWAPFTCRGNEKKNRTAGSQYKYTLRWQTALMIYWFYPFHLR